MNPLPRRSLGRSDMMITPVGIGTAPIASTRDWRIYWGPQDEKEAIRAIQTAVDEVGINWIDTAPFYGWGHGETLVGRAIQGRRDRVFVFTKCGTQRGPQGESFEDLRPATIRREVEESLRRLQIERIDLLQFHDPDPETPIEASWATVQDLIVEGKIRWGGLSNHSVPLIERAAAVGPVISNQHQYNLLNRKAADEILPYSHRNNIGVLTWGPLASGFLVDEFSLSDLDPADFRQKHPYAQLDRWARLERVRDQLRKLAAERRQPLRALAIAWILANPAVSGAIIGVRSPAEARQMADGIDWQLSAEEMGQIDDALAIW